MTNVKENTSIIDKLRTRSEEIKSLIERMKNQEIILDYHINKYQHNIKELEEKKTDLEAQEKEIYKQFLDEIENEDFFQNPPDETIKAKVNECKSNKTKLDNKYKEIQKKEEQLKSLNEKVDNKYKMLPQNKKEIFDVIQKEKDGIKLNKNDKQIKKKNESLFLFISKFSEKFNNNSDHYYEQLKDDNTNLNDFIQIIKRDNNNNKLNNSYCYKDNKNSSKKSKTSTAQSRGDAKTSESEQKIPSHNKWKYEHEQRLPTFGYSQNYNNLGKINRTFFIRTNKILQNIMERHHNDYGNYSHISEEDELHHNHKKKSSSCKFIRSYSSGIQVKKKKRNVSFEKSQSTFKPNNNFNNNGNSPKTLNINQSISKSEIEKGEGDFLSNEIDLN